MTVTGLSALARPPAGETDDFQDLVRRVRAAGLLCRARWRAVPRSGVIGLLYGLGWTALLVLGNSWYQLLIAAYLALVFGQVAFFGHDVGHRQLFPSRRLNRVVGLVCGNLGIGISYRYWVSKHNQHHVHPNEIGADPDVGPGVISWGPAQAAAKKGLSRLIARHQAALFFPLACLEALNLHVSSARAVRRKAAKRAATERILLVIHMAGYLGAVWLALSPLRALCFIVVQQGLFGLYLACAFAPNHKGMTMPSPGEHLGFVRRQVITSRNVRGGRALTMALGGLNYQIEHHLFPTMPMANLRRCQPLVREYCRAHGIDYCETTLFNSYVIALRHLRSTGRSVAKGTGGTAAP